MPFNQTIWLKHGCLITSMLLKKRPYIFNKLIFPGAGKVFTEWAQHSFLLGYWTRTEFIWAVDEWDFVSHCSMALRKTYQRVWGFLGSLLFFSFLDFVMWLFSFLNLVIFFLIFNVLNQYFLLLILDHILKTSFPLPKGCIIAEVSSRVFFKD